VRFLRLPLLLVVELGWLVVAVTCVHRHRFCSRNPAFRPGWLTVLSFKTYEVENNNTE
jgi:hypothetical protein